MVVVQRLLVVVVSAQISADGKTLVMINGNNNVVKQDLTTGASEVLSTSFLGEKSKSFTKWNYDYL